MASDQDYISKAKGLFDNLEVFYLGKKGFLKSSIMIFIVMRK
jgi:hypothetical protein